MRGPSIPVRDRGRPRWGPVLTRHRGPVPYVSGTGPRRSRRTRERSPGKAAGHSPQAGGNNGPAPRMTVNRERGPSPARSRSCRGPKTCTTRSAVPERDAQRKRGSVPADRSNLEPTPHGPVTSPPGASRARPPLRVLTTEHPPRKATHAPTASAHSRRRASGGHHLSLRRSKLSGKESLPARRLWSGEGVRRGGAGHGRPWGADQGRGHRVAFTHHAAALAASPLASDASA